MGEYGWYRVSVRLVQNMCMAGTECGHGWYSVFVRPVHQLCTAGLYWLWRSGAGGCGRGWGAKGRSRCPSAPRS
eukprot:2164873-Rhodomonas_salina.1